MACCYRLDSVQVVAQGGLEDPLDKEEELQDQMDSLPYLCRFQYENTCTYITGLLDPTIKAFTSCEPDTPPSLARHAYSRCRFHLWNTPTPTSTHTDGAV